MEFLFLLLSLPRPSYNSFRGKQMEVRQRERWRFRLVSFCRHWRFRLLHPLFWLLRGLTEKILLTASRDTREDGVSGNTITGPYSCPVIFHLPAYDYFWTLGSGSKFQCWHVDDFTYRCRNGVRHGRFVTQQKYCKKMGHGHVIIPLFAIAAIWFVGFGLCLLLTLIIYFCRKRRPLGCIVLYVGQDRFHSSTTKTLQYVVNQADLTVRKLKDVSESLATAKQVGVDKVFLPSNVQTDIDEIGTKINSSAGTLADKMVDNSNDIRDLLDSVRVALIVIAAIMLLLTFLGFFNYEILDSARVFSFSGRITPAFYDQMTAVVNVGSALYNYAPFLVRLQDCTFVRETFTGVYVEHCPGLRRYSRLVSTGLVMVSTAVMLSLIFWVIYGRERRHRLYKRRISEGPEADKDS
ncbi:putative protein TPRXL-like [Hibiscus syriacus]|uniref:Uncharacterized protein n=1 Tax=Hibiscus syriacus TaxID=106335 RepID=A0A6A3CAF0_HIBSY|nr:putative protein TPRXL-like [Hibiscus syriacus]